MSEKLNMPLYISCDGGKTFQPFVDIQDMEISEEPEQRDYNAAIEMQQYCERYEPTYNPEDGSM